MISMASRFLRHDRRSAGGLQVDMRFGQRTRRFVEEGSRFNLHRSNPSRRISCISGVRSAQAPAGNGSA